MGDSRKKAVKKESESGLDEQPSLSSDLLIERMMEERNSVKKGDKTPTTFKKPIVYPKVLEDL